MDQRDNLEIYCRKLGHHLHFSYCRRENAGMPCAKAASCWQHRFDITGYLTMYYSEDNSISAQPSNSKLTSILSIIEQVKHNSLNSESTDNN
jgi:hypothetical protein